MLSLLGGTRWPADAHELGLDDDADRPPEASYRGQGFLRQALATPPRREMRTRTSLALFMAALVTDIANQAMPLGITMPTGAFRLTIVLMTAALVIIAAFYPRLSEERFPAVEQSTLTFASLLIVYQCSVTGGAGSPYMIWFLLASYYAAYFLPRPRALMNLSFFTLLAFATLLLPETDATDLVILQLVALLATSWSVAGALMRQRRVEDTLQRTITFQALADPLTSTANMRSFDQYLHELARRDGQRFAVLIADVNGLKGANTVFGHEVGDGLLVRMARLMLLASSERDQVARLGGDEFAVIIPDGRAGDVARWRKEFERETDRHNAAVRGRLPQVSVALGSALYPEDGLSPTELLDVADRRMYAEKAATVTPPYEVAGAIAPDAGRAIRQARFLDTPRTPFTDRSRMRRIALNWFIFGVPMIAAAIIGGEYINGIAAAACGAVCMLVVLVTELLRQAGHMRLWIRALDVFTMLFPLPATWAVGGASSPLLITVTLPVVFYAQHMPPRSALPRIAVLLTGFSVAVLAAGSFGPTEQTRYFTALATMVIVTIVMQFSTRQQNTALATIRRAAVLDQLTSLPNVFALRRDLEAAITASRREAGMPVPALIVVDLDDFRRVNTITGHRGGDDVLRCVADRLSDVAGLSRTYRVDGDEFALIVHGLTGRALVSFAERCRASAEHEHSVGSERFVVHASSGYAAWTPDCSGDDLVDRAEATLMRDKTDRRGTRPDGGRLLL